MRTPPSSSSSGSRTVGSPSRNREHAMLSDEEILEDFHYALIESHEENWVWKP